MSKLIPEFLGEFYGEGPHTLFSYSVWDKETYLLCMLVGSLEFISMTSEPENQFLKRMHNERRFSPVSIHISSLVREKVREVNE